MQEGRNVFVTGCSTGIGRHVAEGLAARGYRVFASARRENDLAALEKAGLEPVALDVANEASVEAAAETVLSRCGGRLYALFNNAGYGQPGAVEDLARGVLRDQFEVNVFGAHQLTTLVLPSMRRRREGRIIQNSSILGYIALMYRGAYTASKYALEGLTDTLRIELRGSGVFVSLIEPGPIRSRFRANACRAYLRNIDPSRSAHREYYGHVEARLRDELSEPPFTLGPEAVLDKVVHALESRRPRARYPVTVPARVFAVLRRLLPDAIMDRLVVSTSGGGGR